MTKTWKAFRARRISALKRETKLKNVLPNDNVIIQEAGEFKQSLDVFH